MNPNEKKTFRIGLVLCALMSAIAGPLAYAATRPVVPVAVDEPAPVVQATAGAVEAPHVVEVPEVTIEAKKPAPKPVAKAPSKPRVWTCETREMGRAKYASSNRTYATGASGSVQICGWSS